MFVQRHTGEHIEILEKQKEVYEEAKQKHSERGSHGIRNWSAQKQVTLNPMKESAHE